MALWSKEQISEYYKTAELILPSNSGSRQWKLKTEKGFMHIRHRINTVDKLRKMLVSFAPEKVYHSSSFWLNPTHVRGKYKRSYKYADALMLGCELYFDFDVMHYDKVSSFNAVFFEARMMYSYMVASHPDYKFKKITWSGNHGLAMVFDEPSIAEPDPNVRFEKYHERRRKLREELAKITAQLKFKTFDTNLLTDLYRIYKPEGTIDFSSGYKVTNISPSILLEPVEDIISKIPNVYHTPVSQHLAMIRTDVSGPVSGLVCKSRGEVGRAGVRPSHNFYYFIDNCIGWDDKFVPFIVLPEPHNRNKVLRMQERYGLGTLYAFKYNKSIAYLSLKVVSRRRLQKILKASQSLNYVTFMKYKYNWIRLSGIRNTQGQVEDGPVWFETIPGRLSGNMSRPHKDMLSKYFGMSFGDINSEGISESKIKMVKIKCHQNR